MRAAAMAGARAAARFSTSATSAAKVAFVGLGNMGGPMARNLLQGGHELVVFDLAPAAVASLTSAGAKAASTVKDAARDADAVITMLPNSPHVRSTYEGSVFPVARPGALLIDCSTIDPTVTRALATDAKAKGLRMLDAPVSGGVGGAAAGTLTFMVGGAEADVEAARPLLSKMGRNIVHCGASGTGQIAKLCNNLVLGISMNAVSEAMALGVKLGADPKVLAAIINTSSGRCWSSDTYNPVPGVLPNVPAARGYKGGFGSALMAKDMALALDAAKAAGVPLATGAAAHAVYALMLAHGMGGRDFSAVYPFLRGDSLAGEEK